MKKICFVTASRSEYGLLKYLMKLVDESEEFELQTVVTGGHLLREQGYTVDRIREDGIKVSLEVDTAPDLSTKEGIAYSMGKMAEGMSRAFDALKPDYLVVLGDRYELLPVCGTAFVMGIPIVHISGGDVTKGAIDDGIRNAVTMLSEYHFPGTEESAENVRRMKGGGNNIWAVGEPGLDAFFLEDLMDRSAIGEELGLDVKKKWILMTYHPETVDTPEHNVQTVRNICSALKELSGIQVVMTYANTDPGGTLINAVLEETAEKESDMFRCVPSLGNRRYLSLMRQVVLVVGNSSSGIVEAPSMRIPVVNIGNRQDGRYMCSNVYQSGKGYDEISRTIETALKSETDLSDIDHWGDGKTSERIFSIFRECL